MLGKPVPDFSLSSTGGTAFQLTSKHRQRVQSSGQNKAFGRANCEIFGISRDSLASHQRFKEKMRFPFELLADPEEAVCERFGVMKLKNMYGKQVRGIPKGLRGIKVPGHVQEVLNFVKAL
jgi:peroxiredoxin Q/BCP